MAFRTPTSGVLVPVISSVHKSVSVGYSHDKQDLTCNEGIDSGGQCDQDTKTLGGSVAQGLAGRVGQTSSECTLELGQEGLHGQWDLLQQLVECEEDST